MTEYLYVPSILLEVCKHLSVKEICALLRCSKGKSEEFDYIYPQLGFQSVIDGPKYSSLFWGEVLKSLVESRLLPSPCTKNHVKVPFIYLTFWVTLVQTDCAPIKRKERFGGKNMRNPPSRSYRIKLPCKASTNHGKMFGTIPNLSLLIWNFFPGVGLTYFYNWW